MVDNNMIEMLIKFINMHHGTRFKFTEANMNGIKEILEIESSVPDFKRFIRETDFKEIGLKKSLDMYMERISEKKAKIETVPEVATPTPTTTTGAMGLLEQVLAETIARTQGDKIAKDIMENVETRLDAYIKETYGAIERKVTLVIDDGKKVPLEGVVHEKFDTVLKFVSNDEPVFLTGGAGTGKNVLCQQIAKALELDFYFSNAITQEYKITGFTDAMGVFHETQFYKAFKNGGLFMLDEMDASIPEVLIILNAAIANRYFDFPAPIGYVEAHPDFRIIAAGNTFGGGADYEYVGRSQLDAASLDRFAMVKISYDRNIAMGICGNNQELVDFAWDVRETAEKNGSRMVVSYRAISRINKLEKIMDIQEVIDTCLVKGMEKDDIRMIESKMEKRNKYRFALKEICKND